MLSLESLSEVWNPHIQISCWVVHRLSLTLIGPSTYKFSFYCCILWSHQNVFFHLFCSLHWLFDFEKHIIARFAPQWQERHPLAYFAPPFKAPHRQEDVGFRCPVYMRGVHWNWRDVLVLIGRSLPLAWFYDVEIILIWKDCAIKKSLLRDKYELRRTQRLLNISGLHKKNCQRADHTFDRLPTREREPSTKPLEPFCDNLSYE
jgi:hypothetical protein